MLGDPIIVLLFFRSSDLPYIIIFSSLDFWRFDVHICLAWLSNHQAITASVEHQSIAAAIQDLEAFCAPYASMLNNDSQSV